MGECREGKDCDIRKAKIWNESKWKERRDKERQRKAEKRMGR